MKIGVKTFDSKDFLEYFEDKVDFFEIMALRTNNYSFLKEFNIPIVIHSEHEGLKINPADKTKEKENSESINYAVKIADFSNSKKIIVHPGSLDNKNCTKEQSIKTIGNLYDKRILIENLPLAYNSKKYLASTYEEISEYLKLTNKRLCLDINHSITTSKILKEDYLEKLEKLIKLKPTHYHVSGQVGYQDHLSFEDSEINIIKIINMLPKDAEITLEVSRDIKKTEKDVLLIKNILKKI
jgi:sugar phosphate isomerase/epimerase